MSNAIRALAISGNDLYAGGDFNNAGGVCASGIAKWNGTKWSVQAPTTDPAGGRKRAARINVDARCRQSVDGAARTRTEGSPSLAVPFGDEARANASRRAEDAFGIDITAQNRKCLHIGIQSAYP